METILTQLASAMATGSVKVVDLTQPLEPKTPVLQLPPEYVQNPPFELHELSKYDAVSYTNPTPPTKRRV